MYRDQIRQHIFPFVLTKRELKDSREKRISQKQVHQWMLGKTPLDLCGLVYWFGLLALRRYGDFSYTTVWYPVPPSLRRVTMVLSDVRKVLRVRVAKDARLPFFVLGGEEDSSIVSSSYNDLLQVFLSRQTGIVSGRLPKNLSEKGIYVI